MYDPTSLLFSQAFAKLEVTAVPSSAYWGIALKLIGLDLEALELVEVVWSRRPPS